MSEHKFRYMLLPGTNFRFVDKFKTWIWLSVILTIATMVVLFVNKSRHGDYMNWTIDFSGGTEIVFAFKDKAEKFVEVDAGKVRKAFADAGEHGLDIGEIRYTEGSTSVAGMLVKTPRFSGAQGRGRRSASPTRSASSSPTAASPRRRGRAIGCSCARRSRSPAPRPRRCSRPRGSSSSPGSAGGAKADEGTGEYSQVFAIRGIDRQYEQILESALPGTDAMVVQTSGVGAKAGDKLRDDARQVADLRARADHAVPRVPVRHPLRAGRRVRGDPRRGDGDRRVRRSPGTRYR